MMSQSRGLWQCLSQSIERTLHREAKQHQLQEKRSPNKKLSLDIGARSHLDPSNEAGFKIDFLPKPA